METLNAVADPGREPTDFEEFVRDLERDPDERVQLEQARAELRARLAKEETDHGDH
jgi:hypothetical protein